LIAERGRFRWLGRRDEPSRIEEKALTASLSVCEAGAGGLGGPSVGRVGAAELSTQGFSIDYKKLYGQLVSNVPFPVPWTRSPKRCH
jgi:hypothetical protein